MSNDQVTIWGAGLKFGRKPGDGELLIGNGASFDLATLSAGSGISISNASGAVTISASGGGTVTAVTATSPLKSSGGTAPDISLDGTIAVSNGGTGQSSLTANNVILGDGTNAVKFVAPGTSGNLLTSNGTTWTSEELKWKTVFKTSDQSIASSTAFVDVSQLSFAVTSGTYTFDFIIPVTAGAGGIRLAVNGPTLTSLYAALANNTTSIVAYDTSIITLSGAGTLVVRIHGVVTVSASGTFTLRFAQQSSDAADSKILAGSIVHYGRMP